LALGVWIDCGGDLNASPLGDGTALWMAQVLAAGPVKYNSAVYFFESGLFNGLRAFGVKKFLLLSYRADQPCLARAVEFGDALKLVRIPIFVNIMSTYNVAR
jgi:hypothetical protein